MTNIIKQNGFFARVLNQDGLLTTTPLVDFIHGYEKRNGQKIPITTICIVPFMDSGKLWFGIGMSQCSELDQPVKARGRRISEARAREVIKADGDLRWKPDYIGGGRQHKGSICGIRTHEADANLSILEMLFHSSMHERIIKSLDFLRKLCNAESVT